MNRPQPGLDPFQAVEHHLTQSRNDYTQAALDESHVLSQPVDQLLLWLNDAVQLGIHEPNAMHLCTVGPDAMPSARIVLLRGIEAGALRFYTNYQSRKAAQIADNQAVAITFFWATLERQIRIEGHAQALSTEVSNQYFNSRPFNSRIGAWASPQSQVIANRQELESLFETYQKKFEGQTDIPLPPHWGGYEVIPHYFEFWQGRRSRLHDRIVFEAHNLTETDTITPLRPLQAYSEWKMYRLAP
jgi:pyridoxamine 5'-phosphate oxidase